MRDAATTAAKKALPDDIASRLEQNSHRTVSIDCLMLGRSGILANLGWSQGRFAARRR
jgi:hypothetical protein